MKRSSHAAMRWGGTLLGGAALALALLTTLPQPADGDVVRLRTGVAIKGDPSQEASSQDALVILDRLTRGLRTVSWDVVAQQDRDRLWEAWGWLDRTRRVIQGHRVRQRLADGSISDIIGLVVEDNPGGIVVRVGGKDISIPRKQVVEIIDEEVSPLDVYTPEQIYERARADLREDMVKEGVDPDTLEARHHFRLAEICNWCGYLEKAVEHYRVCADDSAFLRAPIAKKRLDDVEALLRDQDALRALRNVRVAARMNNYTRAHARVAAFEAEHADSSEAVTRKFEQTKELVQELRTKFFRKQAAFHFPREVRKLIKAKVREKDIERAEIVGWAKRELGKFAFEALTERLKKHDEALMPGHVEVFWKERHKKTGWSTAGLGAGTFVVFKPKIKPPKKKSKGTKRRRSSGPAPKVVIPKPPTPDSWWAKSSNKSRVEWLMAYFVLESDLFEVSDRKIRTACPKCAGRGLEENANSNGTLTQYLCTRCAGAQQDVRVRFR